jgi:hypothetical protein
MSRAFEIPGCKGGIVRRASRHIAYWLCEHDPTPYNNATFWLLPYAGCVYCHDHDTTFGCKDCDHDR